MRDKVNRFLSARKCQVQPLRSYSPLEMDAITPSSSSLPLASVHVLRTEITSSFTIYYFFAAGSKKVLRVTLW